MKFKKSKLTPLEELVSVPANHMSRYSKKRHLSKPKSLVSGEKKEVEPLWKVEGEIKTQIYGKPKEYTAYQILLAGMETYPNLKKLHFESTQPEPL